MRVIIFINKNHPQISEWFTNSQIVQCLFFSLPQTVQYDLHARQPVLDAILTEGHDLLGALKGHDATDFQDKLLRLDDQFNKVLMRANDQTVSVDRVLAMWERYMNAKLEVESRLDQAEKQLEDVGSLDHVPLQKLNQALSTIQVGERH